MFVVKVQGVQWCDERVSGLFMKSIFMVLALAGLSGCAVYPQAAYQDYGAEAGAQPYAVQPPSPLYIGPGGYGYSDYASPYLYGYPYPYAYSRPYVYPGPYAYPRPYIYPGGYSHIRPGGFPRHAPYPGGHWGVNRSGQGRHR